METWEGPTASIFSIKHLWSLIHEPSTYKIYQNLVPLFWVRCDPWCEAWREFTMVQGSELEFGFGSCLEQATRGDVFGMLSSSGGSQERRGRELPFLSMLRKTSGAQDVEFSAWDVKSSQSRNICKFSKKNYFWKRKKSSVFFIILILWLLLYVKLCLLSPGDVAPSYYPHIPSNPLLTYRHLFIKKKFIGQMWSCMPATQNMGCINRRISVI